MHENKAPAASAEKTFATENALQAPLAGNGSASATKPDQDIQYVWTKDPKLLLQYFEVREKCYREYLQLRDFSGHFDEGDPSGHALVALDRDGICVGGARLTVFDQLTEAMLPMESYGFRLPDLLPELNLEHVLYAELSRVALLNQYRTGNYSDKIYEEVMKRCIRMGVRYVFAVAPMPQSRRSRRTCERLGMRAVIRDDIKVPGAPIHEGLGLHLMFCEIPLEEKKL